MQNPTEIALGIPIPQDGLGAVIADLELFMENLSPKNREFAQSLCESYHKFHNLSPRQRIWVRALLDWAMGTGIGPVTKGYGHCRGCGTSMEDEDDQHFCSTCLRRYS